MGINDEISTLQNIHRAAKNEFLKKGFKSASLRNIVKMAGVTTGAFYGYYRSKENLFEALVEEPASVLMDKFIETQNTFATLPPEDQQENMGGFSGDYMDWMVGYVYENLDAFKLLLCCSEGTRYENLIHQMVEIEVNATHNFIAVLKGLGRDVKDIDPKLEHLLISGMFTAFFEMVVHDMPLDQARIYTKELRAFHMAGWREIMGL